jgi:asparagine synthetase B (glutamine-hydrolysing)
MTNPIRNILQEYIQAIPDDEVVVFLSGGADSLSIAFAADSVGKKVHTHTFHVEGIPSYDARKAEEVSEKYKWNFHLHVIPRDNILEDFKTLLNDYDCQKKTEFECTWPFLYMYPKIPQRHLLTGLGADANFGLSKKCCIHYKHTKELFDQYRTETYAKGPGSLRQHLILAEKYKKVYHTPYISDPIREYLMKFTWEELNKPVEKGPIITAFQEYFSEIKWRKHTNLQLDAQIDDVFADVLLKSDLNIYNRNRMLEFYKDWVRIKNEGMSVLPI